MASAPTKRARTGAAGTVPDAAREDTLFVFAHGAGASSSSDWMVAWRKRLETLGVVHTFDYDYKKRGKRMPDKHDKLQACHKRELLAALHKHHFEMPPVRGGEASNGEHGAPGGGAPRAGKRKRVSCEDPAAPPPRRQRVVLVGKSMGSRMGVHLVQENEDVRVDGIVCFGYPLVSASGKRRDAVLVGVDTPVLFFAGTRDKMCPAADLRASMETMDGAELDVVDEGDHSLLVTKRRMKREGITQDDVDAGMLARIDAFVRSLRSV